MSLQGKDREELEKKLQTYVGVQIGPPETGKDLVNEAMIRHWCAAMDDRNPAYTDPEAAKRSLHGGIVAPPTMMQAWVLGGMDMADPAKTPMHKETELHQLLTDYGYPSVVATNCEQHYQRYLRPGDQVSLTTTIESISEQKATALGIGYFIETMNVFRDPNGQEVGRMKFRVLKFKPAQEPQAATESEAAPTQPTRLRPPMGHDNAWWWEAIDRGELRIQKCGSCGTLRHPPRPMCDKCQSTDWDSQVSQGRGTVYSYTVMHHPKVPGFEYPFAIVLIELEEGTRIVSNLAGCDPGEVHIGMPVELSIEHADEQLKLPFFRPAR
jgi:uncharacterized OB-fold protein/acyl dehydratase